MLKKVGLLQPLLLAFLLTAGFASTSKRAGLVPYPVFVPGWAAFKDLWLLPPLAPASGERGWG